MDSSQPVSPQSPDSASLVDGSPAPKIMPPEDGKVVLADDVDKVKFIPHEASHNGEAKVEMEDAVSKVAFAGMGKEELMKFAEDPYWMRVRWTLFILFWLLWAGMLAGAIVIIVLAPKCEAPPPRSWWQRSTVYEVNPRSFKDSKDDANGDIPGIISKIDYLKKLGTKTILLEPIYRSRLEDMGYDVMNFTEVEPVYGSMEDFEALVAKLHSNDMKLVLDFVPNHSGRDHPWFAKSVRREDPYTDFYVWAKKKDDGSGVNVPPNNWLSKYGDSAWEYNEIRGEYYLHQFAVSEPDLNYRSEALVEEMKGTLKFWLDKGVDGFRFTDVAYLLEDESLRDESRSLDSKAESYKYDYLEHNLTYNQPGILDVLLQFREVLDSYETSDGEHRVMITEADLPVEEAMLYYGNSSKPISDLPLNFAFVNLQKEFNAQDILKLISSWLDNMPKSRWANWVLGGRNDKRVATRFGEDLIDAFNIIINLLPGTAFTYYGDEIGMTDTFVPFDATRDVAGLNAGHEEFTLFSRDPERTPMQWNSDVNAGFSNVSKTWLPVNKRYDQINVQLQEEAKTSHLKLYRLLTAARDSESILYGDLEMKVLNGTELFAFTRVKKGTLCYLAAVNFGTENVVADFSVFKGMPADATVYIRSVQNSPPDLPSKVQTSAVPMDPSSSLVLTFPPKL